MSIDLQAGLDNVERAREIDEDFLENERNAVTADGPRYGTTSTSRRERRTHPRDEHECQTCGTTLELYYRRQFGDRNNIVWHCNRGCPATEGCPDVTATDMKDGAGYREDYFDHLNTTNGAGQDALATDGGQDALPDYMLPGGGN